MQQGMTLGRSNTSMWIVVICGALSIVKQVSSASLAYSLSNSLILSVCFTDVPNLTIFNDRYGGVNYNDISGFNESSPSFVSLYARNMSGGSYNLNRLSNLPMTNKELKFITDMSLWQDRNHDLIIDSSVFIELWNFRDGINGLAPSFSSLGCPMEHNSMPLLVSSAYIGHAAGLIEKRSQVSSLSRSCTPTYYVIHERVCDSITLNGYTYNISGTYTQSLINAAGCDSIITLHLSVLKNDTTLEVTACDGYYFQDVLLTSPGTYTYILTNAAGCDSVITLHLSLLHSDIVHLSDTACDNYWFQGHMLTSSGRYSVLLTNAAGCDSIVFLDLYIPPDSVIVRDTTCDSYVFNGVELTTSGTYRSTLVGTRGCDSTVILHLTVIHIDTTVTQTGHVLMANEASATYQWLDCETRQPLAGETQRLFTATASGNYAVQITEHDCTALSACHQVVVVSVSSAGQVVRIYPNPVSVKLIIAGNIPHASIRLWSAAGMLVSVPTDYNADQIMVDLSSLAPGTYVMEIGHDQRIIHYKVLRW